MSDLLKTGSDWLQAKLKAHASQSVTYKRGSAANVVLATPAGTQIELAGDNITVVSETRDWLINRADLSSDPERGDVIEFEVNEETRQYEVMPIGGDRHFRESDRYGLKLRIHTKFIGIA